MKRTQMLVFFIIVLTIYTLANFYLFHKGINFVPLLKDHRITYAIIYFFLAFTFIGAKFIESRHSSVITDILNIIGGFWMAFLLYGFIFLFLPDVIVFLLRLVRIISPNDAFTFRKWLFYFTLVASFFLITGGFINALNAGS
jgi:hypothetical protein